jgi:putative ABC transport system substrate-binding protein
MPFFVLLFVWLFAVLPAAADELQVAVIYPDTKEPLATVFGQIIGGIRESVGHEVRAYSVARKPDDADLRRWYEQQSVDIVVALGKRGIESAKRLAPSVPVIVGGVLYLPVEDSGRLAGLSLTPDPARLFEKLRELGPQVKRVRVVYNPEHYEWLMRIAVRAAKRQGLELVTKPATDIKSAAHLYREFVRESKSDTDAIWLLPDSSTMGDAAILSFLLEEAWRRSLRLFSSSLSHVQRGVLFSLYADKPTLGRRLGELARMAHKGRLDPGMQPIAELRMAINLRTASHLGMRFSYQQQRGFDLVFPQR